MYNIWYVVTGPSSNNKSGRPAGPAWRAGRPYHTVSHFIYLHNIIYIFYDMLCIFPIALPIGIYSRSRVCHVLDLD